MTQTADTIRFIHAAIDAIVDNPEITGPAVVSSCAAALELEAAYCQNEGLAFFAFLNEQAYSQANDYPSFVEWILLVGADRAKVAASRVVRLMHASGAYMLTKLTDDLNLAQDTIAAFGVKIAYVNEAMSGMPSDTEEDNAILEAITNGRQIMQATIDGLTQKSREIQLQIDALGLGG